MPSILDLYKEAELLHKEIEYHRENYRLEKKKLSIIEDSIVESKEKLRSLTEEIRLQESATNFQSLIDENRESEIASFRDRLPTILLKDK